MWIQVRSMDGKTTTRIDGLSKLTKIEELRIKLVEHFDAPVNRQRLFYRGKQLEDGHTLFDYDVGLNDIIQILVKSVLSEGSGVSAGAKNECEGSSTKKENSSAVLDKENERKVQSSKTNEVSLKESYYFRINDLIDAKDSDYGAWFEAKIIGIIKRLDVSDSSEKCINTDSGAKVMQNIVNSRTEDNTEFSVKSQNMDDSLLFHVSFQSYEEEPEFLPLDRIRPRARKILKLNEIKEGEMVMVNYNIDEPNKRGFWYDCIITRNVMKGLYGTLFVGTENTPLENCHILFKDEVFAIEELVPLTERKVEVKQQCDDDVDDNIQRKTKPQCTHCKDIPSRKCKHCGCHICGGKNEPEKQILCDECDLPYHIWCLDPPLSQIPNVDQWYCPLCKNDENEVIKPGEKLKGSKKKSKMASAMSSSSRDWGKGMACVGRTKDCTIVPPNHFGPVPGIEVGMMWKFRVQVSESGVHRPHVAGIHGRESEGAYSIVLSGGYEDDLDEGDEFKYTGSGGRDLSGNKRTADQSCDQKLTRMNRALALNCAIKLNNKGGEAEDWRKGKPVRVVRNCKGRKHSVYCPEEGNRYDGIYKVVKYWPEKGKSGYLVWRYLLRRDDPTPAPWTKEGKQRIKRLNFTLQYPEGYIEAQTEASSSNKKKNKRSCDETLDDDSAAQNKKLKTLVYTLPADVDNLIVEDRMNKKIWQECKSYTAEGITRFLKQVENHFLCICCQDLVVEPVTTECLHNICKTCLRRSFKAQVYYCPMCRHDLGKDYIAHVNSTLSAILCKLFPGYNAGR